MEKNETRKEPGECWGCSIQNSVVREISEVTFGGGATRGEEVAWELTWRSYNKSKF